MDACIFGAVCLHINNDACVLMAEERNRDCFSVWGDCGRGQTNSFRLGDVAISTAEVAHCSVARTGVAVKSWGVECSVGASGWRVGKCMSLPPLPWLVCLHFL